MPDTIDRDSFVYQAGGTGVLLLHGFTGTPAEMRGLGAALHKAGHTVHAPLLAGHGRRPEDLRYVSWEEWLAGGERALEYVRRQCERIVIVGFSMGGALGVLLAERQAPAGLVCLATPARLGDWRAGLLPILRHAVPWWYPYRDANMDDPSVRAQVASFAPGADLADPATRRAIGDIRLPTAALDELHQLLNRARKHAPYVGAPALVAHGRRDDVTAPEDAYLLYGALGSARKRLVWYEEAGHLLIAESGSERVWADIGSFVAEVTSNPGSGAAV